MVPHILIQNQKNYLFFYYHFSGTVLNRMSHSFTGISRAFRNIIFLNKPTFDNKIFLMINDYCIPETKIWILNNMSSHVQVVLVFVQILLFMSTATNLLDIYLQNKKIFAVLNLLLVREDNLEIWNYYYSLYPIITNNWFINRF